MSNSTSTGRFNDLGRQLYTGEKSFDFVYNWKRNLGVGVALCAIAAILLSVFQLNPGIEFRGGSEFRVSGVENADESIAEETVKEMQGDSQEPAISTLGSDTIRVQTGRLDETETNTLKEKLAQAYNVDVGAVSASFIGPSWGEDITRQALIGLGVFLALVSVVIALYFRTAAMAAGALVALAHDLLITTGVFAATRFEVTPASVIGLLTILGYSLYDTIVVFEKARENTVNYEHSLDATYAERVNLAVNQTVVRSISTSIVALLPVGSILFIGAFLLGAGTLRDISLALFVGIIVGTYSSIFVAPSVFMIFRGRESRIKAHTAAVERARAEAINPEAMAGAIAGGTGADAPVGGEEATNGAPKIAPGHQRPQPKRH